MHAREQILQAVVGKLTGLPTTGANVFLGRVSDLAANELPAILVRSGSESVAPLTLAAPRQLERRLTVLVGAVVRVADGLDTALNAIASEIEPALAMPNPLSGLNVAAVTLRGLAAPRMEQGQQPVADITMQYEITYITAEDDPDVLA